MDQRWQIKLLGGLQARQGDRVVAHFRTRKTGMLLAYLAYYQQRAHTREELTELLWPECDPELGRQSFRKALSSLRCQLEPDAFAAGILEAPVFLVDRTSVQLNPAVVTTDVAELERALRSAARAGSSSERAQRLMDAMELYQGELLPGHYEDWILQERRWLAETYFQALGQLVAHLEQEGDFGLAQQYAQRGMRADPHREAEGAEGASWVPGSGPCNPGFPSAAHLSPQEATLVRRLLNAVVELLLNDGFRYSGKLAPNT